MSEYKSNSATISDAGLYDVKSSITLKASQAQSSLGELNNLLSLLKHISLSSISLATYTNKKRLEVIQSFLEQLSEVPQPRGCKSNCNKLRNEIISIKEGILSGEKLTREDLVLTTLPSVITTVNERIATAKKVIEKAKAVMAGQESALHEIDRDIVESSDLTRIYQQVEAESSVAIERVKQKPYVVARMPVIPLGNLSKEVAEKNGFKVSGMQGYLVFHDQVLIGINKSLLSKSEDWNKGLEKINIFDVLNTIIDSINVKTKQSYVLLDKQPFTSVKSGGMGVSWYWIMPSRQANVFAKLFKTRLGVSSIKLQGWGLAV